MGTRPSSPPSEAPQRPAPPAAGGLRQQVGQALAWNALFTPLKFAIDIFATIIRLHFLSKAEVGVLSLLSATANTAGVVVDLGIDATLPKFIPEIEQQRGRGAAWRFFLTVIRFKMLVLLFVLLLLPLWGGRLLRWMQNEVGVQAIWDAGGPLTGLFIQLREHGWLFIGAVIVLVICGSLFDTLRAYLVSFFRQKAWNILTAGATLLLPILSVIAVLLGWGVLGVLGAMVLVPILSVGATAWHVRRVAAAGKQAKGDQGVPREVWRRWAILAAVTFLIIATDYLASQYFVVYWLRDLQDAAIFWVAFSFVKQIQSYAYTPLVGIQIPMFTRVRAEGGERLPQVYRLLMHVMLVLFVPLALGLLIVMPNLIMVQYPEYAAAIVPALMLVGFLFLEPFWGVPQNIMIVHEEYRNLLLTRCLSLVSIPLLVVLTPLLGIAGAVWAIGLSRAITGIAAILLVRRTHRLQLPWRFAGKIALISGGMLLCLLPLALLLGISPAQASIALRLRYTLGVVALGFVGAAVWVLLARAFHLLEAGDRALLRELRNPLARRIAQWL